MTLESTIIDLTSRTPSGGTCLIGDVPFSVWYCSDCWEWEFQGVYYFDPQDLSEAIEAFVEGRKTGARETIPQTTEVRPKLGPARRTLRSVAHRKVLARPVPGSHGH